MQSQRRNAPVLAGLGLLLVLGGFLIGRLSSPNDVPGQEAPGPSDSGPPSAAADKATALEVATQFARAIAGPSEGTGAYIDEAVAFAAPEWRGRAAELAENTLAFIEERYGEEGQIVFHPVKYRVEAQSEEQAVVDIWGVTLGSGPNLAGIEESWLTGTIHLSYVDGEWKVSDQSSVGGPTPELLRTEDDFPVSRVLEEFEEYDDVPSP